MKRLPRGSSVVGALGLLFLFGPSSTVGTAWAQPTTQTADEILLRSHGAPTDGAGLQEFFRIRSQGTVASEKLAGLIEQLGNEGLAVRERACGELLAIGPLAIPALRQAVKDPDVPRVAALAERCLQALEHHSASLTSAALRLLALRKPEGVGETILTFLPLAEDDGVVEEARRALALVTVKNGKIDPGLERYIDDKVSIRRATVLDVLCQQARREHHPLLRRLLRDPSANVRVRAALALAANNEAEAIEALIDLLGELPLVQGRQAEDLLTSLAGDMGPKILLGEDEISRKNCRQAWRNWWNQPPAEQSPAGLLEEVRKRTPTEANRAKLQALVDNLGDDAFEVREKASADLKDLGTLTLPLLRVAARSPDAEVSRRAQSLMQEIDNGKTPPLPFAVLRLLAVRKPTGTAETLLGFLPYVEDEAMSDDLQQTLNAVASRQGKPDPALLRGLEDRTPLRRAAAAEALCFNDDPETAPAVRKMLKDPETIVRLRVALALTNRRDREAVPVLIALVAEAPPELTDHVEDCLRSISADHSPPEMPGGASPKQRVEVWSAWWSAQGPRVELPERAVAVLPGRPLGYTLLVQPQNNQVSEVDHTGKVRWTLPNLTMPQDAQVLPGDRVLVAEFGGLRVTERNLKGEILWQKVLPSQPINAQRLSDGRTFIALRNQLVEVDRMGKEVATIPRPLNDVMSAWKTREGQIVLITNQAMCIRMDRTGKELKSFRVQGVSSFGNEVLANGHILVPLSWQNKVMEYDAEGKIVWEAGLQAGLQQPISASRLPNGNTLVACQVWPPRIVELDKSGKQVAEIKTTMYTSRVRRR
jgi:HEAT repeat protein